MNLSKNLFAAASCMFVSCLLLLSPAPVCGGSADYNAGKIKRSGAKEAQSSREAYREEENKQADSADRRNSAKQELYEYYSNTLYRPVQIAMEPPGNDIARHLEATEKISSEMPKIRKLLNDHTAIADDSTYQDLQMVADKAAQWRAQAARHLVSNAENMMDFPRKSKGGDLTFGNQIAEVKKTLDFAARYDANNPDIRRLQTEIASLEKGAAGAVSARKWEGHKNAPSDVGELAAAAMKYFKGPKGWADKYTVLAVAIRGQWTVQKRNIVGAPILYGIAVHLAVQKEEDKKQKQARVFNGTLITVEKEGVKSKPPFDGFYVGDSWLVNADSVK